MHPHNGAESAAQRAILPGWCRMLIEAGDLDQQTSETIFRSNGTDRFAHHLLAYGVVSAWKVAHAMSMSFQIPIVDLDAIDEKSLPHTVLDNPLWQWLVRTRWPAYCAKKTFDGPSPFKAGSMWCFDRFGTSETALEDGRTVHIGGEHEDFYDPDFHIYNDVIVVSSGGQVAIYGYPLEAFPPIDFHSATLVGNAIITIGGLGYPAQRTSDSTPVFQLALDTMTITRIDTTGERPGWIHRHVATLESCSGSIVVRGGEFWRDCNETMYENIDAWFLF